MTTTRVFQLNTELYKVTGIQRVVLDIHEALREDYDATIVGTIPYDKVDKSLRIVENDYIRFRNPLKFHNSVVIVHERRLLPLMWMLTHIPGLNVKCIYVHHNELYGNKQLSLFPKNIVAISDAGIKNLTEYFGVPIANITKIHNCVRETTPYIPRTKEFNPDDISILYPARINGVKRQVEIVNHLKGKLDSRIKILFAGTGPQYDELKLLCKDSIQFQTLGFRDDISALMRECDFMMLYSKQEGLPVSLIEANQVGLPSICNNIGGNVEIINDGENGILVDDWNDLLCALNTLPNLDQLEIIKLQSLSRKKYLNDFTFDIFKHKYSSLIRRIYDNA